MFITKSKLKIDVRIFDVISIGSRWKYMYVLIGKINRPKLNSFSKESFKESLYLRQKQRSVYQGISKKSNKIFKTLLKF